MPRIIFVFFWIISVSVSAQVEVDPEIYCRIPKQLPECSSLEALNDSTFWSLNDKGDKARIFCFGKNAPARSVKLEGVDAVDFEAMARNRNTGEIFVGDIGNNLNDRKNLVIWKTGNAANTGVSKLKPEGIFFTYPDQHDFPPARTEMKFDAEALFHYNHQLWIFSKDRSGTHYCKAYHLPDTSGTYTAVLADSIKLSRWVTSADISPDGKKIFLLSETEAWLFWDFPADHFFEGKKIHFRFNGWTQKEGVCFVNDSTLLISDETTTNKGGNIYRLEIGQWLKMADGKALLNITNGKNAGQKTFVYRNEKKSDAVFEILNEKQEAVFTHPLHYDPVSILSSCSFDFSTTPGTSFTVRISDSNGIILSELMNNR